MKIPLATLAALTLLAAFASSARAEIVEKTLVNGLKVIVKTDRRAPVVVNQVWYRAGSMDENYGVTGVAHVLEHMMFKGTKDTPSGEFSKRIAAAGGRENAFTNRDHTAYFQTLQKDRLELAMKLEADRMANLILSADEFAKEINVVMEERRMRTEDNPHSRLYEAMMAAAYQTHPYHHPVIGWMQDLKNMTVDDARQWYQNWYAPNNATVVIAGDVEPQQVFTWAEKYYGPLAARPLPVRKAVSEVAQAGLRQLILKAPAKLPVLALAWQTPRLLDPTRDSDPYALEILAGVLDGHASARLNQSLVREKQLATEVGAGYDSISRGPALFMVDATPAEGQSAAAVEKALKDEIARLVKEGVSENELKRVKAQVLASQVYQQDSLFYQAMLIGEWTTAGMDYKDRETRYARLKEVTAEQVQAVAKKYLVDDRLTVAVLDPQPLPTDKPKFGVNPMGGRHGR
ncbi:MAG: insulinase family protein [Betaproteobacteria bacterium]|nr:insulinase family protein [Betaproteobacteria bacterium]